MRINALSLAAPGCESTPSRSPRMRIIALSQPRIRINAVSRPAASNQRPLGAPGCESPPSRSQPRIRIIARSGPPGCDQRALARSPGFESARRFGTQESESALRCWREGERERPRAAPEAIRHGRLGRFWFRTPSWSARDPGLRFAPTRGFRGLPWFRRSVVGAPFSRPEDPNQRRLAAPDSNQRPLSAPGSESAPSLSPGCESTPSRSPAPSRACHSTPGSKSVVR